MSKVMQLKAQIRNIAKQSGVSAQAVLQNFMLERFLGRISVSGYKDKFILKGGMLIASLVGTAYRTTMDMDATLRHHPISKGAIEKTLRDICTIKLDDGITFELDYLEEIRDEDSYGGYRAALIAHFGSIRTPLKVDLTTGVKLTPDAILYAYPSAFEEKTFEIWAYNLETVLAEKVETILRRSTFNTRARDFYDVYILLTTHKEKLDNVLFKRALEATIEHRASSASLEKSKETLLLIQADPLMQQRWKRYTRAYAYAQGVAFDEIIKVLVAHLS